MQMANRASRVCILACSVTAAHAGDGAADLHGQERALPVGVQHHPRVRRCRGQGGGRSGQVRASHRCPRTWLWIRHQTHLSPGTALMSFSMGRAVLFHAPLQPRALPRGWALTECTMQRGTSVSFQTRLYSRGAQAGWCGGTGTLRTARAGPTQCTAAGWWASSPSSTAQPRGLSTSAAAFSRPPAGVWTGGLLAPGGGGCLHCPMSAVFALCDAKARVLSDKDCISQRRVWLACFCSDFIFAGLEAVF
jgi:hypothetical protein